MLQLRAYIYLRSGGEMAGPSDPGSFSLRIPRNSRDFVPYGPAEWPERRRLDARSLKTARAHEFWHDG